MYVLMGASGNITSNLAKILCGQGKRVRVIGRNAEAMASLRKAGADLATGDATDQAFLEKAFSGADAVYTMIPPKLNASNQRTHQNKIGQAIAFGIASNRIPRVISLSSIGAALPNGTGPIAGLHDQEERLNKIGDLNILHLRPAYFMENHLQALGMIKTWGMYPGMIDPDVAFPMIATADIAEYVAQEMVNPTFKGSEVRHLLGPANYSMTDAARILGKAIGKPDLQYVKADPVRAKSGLMQNGVSKDVADSYEEMSNALSDGRITNSITGTIIRTRTTLEQFVDGLDVTTPGERPRW